MNSYVFKEMRFSNTVKFLSDSSRLNMVCHSPDSMPRITKIRRDEAAIQVENRVFNIGRTLHTFQQHLHSKRPIARPHTRPVVCATIGLSEMLARSTTRTQSIPWQARCLQSANSGSKEVVAMEVWRFHVLAIGPNISSKINADSNIQQIEDSPMVIALGPSPRPTRTRETTITKVDVWPTYSQTWPGWLVFSIIFKSNAPIYAR